MTIPLLLEYEHNQYNLRGWGKTWLFYGFGALTLRNCLTNMEDQNFLWVVANISHQTHKPKKNPNSKFQVGNHGKQ